MGDWASLRGYMSLEGDRHAYKRHVCLEIKAWVWKHAGGVAILGYSN